MIPTYNEKENIAGLIKEIDELKLKNIHILVVDDNSPDGTAQVVKRIAKQKKNVHLLLRKANKGRGSAGRAGFMQCLKEGATHIIEMDADFSHDPRYIPSLLKSARDADVVLGSRRVRGGREVGRGTFRRFVTWGANLYIRLILGIRVRPSYAGMWPL